MITEETFNGLVKETFKLEYHIYKEKLAYWMVIWDDKSDGSVFGPFAGHGHNCRLAGFDYRGWAYAYDGSNWYLQPDGMNAWRNKGVSNPFPQFEEKRLETW